MYLEHYGLRELPFSLTPDTSYFFAYGHFRDAFDTLTVALANGEGFIKVTGEVGTGKTLLCRKLLNSLDEHYATAYIPNPQLTPPALIFAVAEELGLVLPRNQGAHRALKMLFQHLINLTGKGKQVVVCIDEAQAMPEQTLETLRLLTNLETEKRKLLQVVLFGQPELDVHLAKPSVRQLRQRITFSYTLRPIDRDGLDAYIQHRLLVAGGNGQVRFTPAALHRLYRGSGGIPRLINILAHKALMAGYGEGVRTIGPRQVRLAIDDTEGAVRAVSPLPRLAAVTLVVLLLGSTLYLLVSRPVVSPSVAGVSLGTDTPPSPQTKEEAVMLDAAAEEVTPLAQAAAGEESGAQESGLADGVSATAVEPVEGADSIATPTEATPPAAARAHLQRVLPARLQGSWEAQTLLLEGEGFRGDERVVVQWGDREKLLSPEQVEWLDDATLRVTLVTGVSAEQWAVALEYVDGGRSEAVSFDVVTSPQP